MNAYDHAAAFVALVGLGALAMAFVNPWWFVPCAVLTAAAHWLGRRGLLA